MSRTQFLSRWINKKGEPIDVFQLDVKGREFQLKGPGRSSSQFYGDYAQLLKKLKSEGFESKSRHEETETIDNFMDKILAEVALKPGQKKKIPTTVKVKLSPAAQAALKLDPKTTAEKKKIEAELKKHEAEFKKLNALLNQARIKRDNLHKAKKLLGNTITPQQAKYFSLIEKECSQFVKDMKTAKCLLFRGMNDVGDVVYGKPHENRHPMDTQKHVQKRLDKILTAAGFKALRSNSIFTTGDIGQAENYGDAYIIFPKNGYDFTWSSKHGDWIPTMGSMRIKGVGPSSIDWANVYDVIDNMISKFIYPDDYWDSDNPSQKIKLDKFLKHPLFKSVKSGLSKMYDQIEDLDTWDDEEPTLKQQADYLVILKNLLKLNMQLADLKILNTNTIKKITKWIEIISKAGKKNTVNIPQEFVKSFVLKHGLKNTDMPAALKSNHEIYIHGEYIALDFDKFRSAAVKYFFNGDIKNINTKWYDDDDDDY